MNEQGFEYAFTIYALAKHNYSEPAYQLLFGIPMMRELFYYHIKEKNFDPKVVSDLEKDAGKARSILSKIEIDEIFLARDNLNKQ